MNGQSRLSQKTRRAWAVFRLAARKFSRIGGERWGGAFAFHAFFSLFPLMVLLVTTASILIDRDRAITEVIAYAETYVPISGEMRDYIFDTIAGVIEARGQVGVAAFLILVWVAIRCFTILVSAINRAWGFTANSWWRLPLKSLVLLGVTAGGGPLGTAGPARGQRGGGWGVAR